MVSEHSADVSTLGYSPFAMETEEAVAEASRAAESVEAAAAQLDSLHLHQSALKSGRPHCSLRGDMGSG